MDRRTLLGFVLALLASFGANIPRAGARDVSPTLEAFTVGTGPPLVMLGGGTLGAAEFEPHAQELASHRRVIRLQTLNISTAQAHARLPADYSIDMESDAMLRSIESLGLQAPFDLVGHSLGALVALDFALDHPERIHTLVLAEPPAFWVISSDERRAMADLRAMEDITRTLVPTSEPTDEQFIRFQCALGNCGAQLPAAGSAELERWIARRSSLRGLSAVANHSDDAGRLRAFTRPVLIVTGKSTVAFHRRVNDLLASNLPGAERAELPGGHSAPWTARAEFISSIESFFARHP